MLHARQPGNIEKAVLQIPFVFSCHQGNIDTAECPDALIVHDFDSCRAELLSRGFTGIAILIDEADCLGTNVPLLQMFRNIFQVVEHCSLILAGTEAIFPVLSEVFSPIPRQFHRVDVKPFAGWIDTMQLVLQPISKDLAKSVAPKVDVIEELHELCGGAPDEVQLYCHHMYKVLEEGLTDRMALSPLVYREVLREYRSNTPANIESVLNAIESLPDELLYGSMWVARRKLTIEQNVKVAIFRRELRLKGTLSPDERTEIARSISDGYHRLFDAGITESRNSIQLIGAPLTAGFWKSFVNVKRGKRWSWNDDSYADNLHEPVMRAIGGVNEGVAYVSDVQGQDAVAALRSLRDGKTPSKFDEGMSEMILATLVAQGRQSTHAADLTVQIESPAGRQTRQARYLERAGVQLTQERFQESIDKCRALLAGSDISLFIAAFDRFELPTDSELHLLGNISGSPIPEINFTRIPSRIAMEKFEQGDIQGCMDIFASMLADRESANIRNNLAFCQILVGDLRAGLDNATKAVTTEFSPLYVMNKCVAQFMLGHVEVAKESLTRTWQKLRDAKNSFDVGASYVLVLDPQGDKVASHAKVPVDVAILVNLWRMRSTTRDELERSLMDLYPDTAQTWLNFFEDLDLGANGPKRQKNSPQHQNFP